MVPVAPGLLSTTTVWLSRCCSDCDSTRATMSVEPPGGKGTTIVIGRSGHDPWAMAGRGPVAARPIARTASGTDSASDLLCTVLSPGGGTCLEVGLEGRLLSLTNAVSSRFHSGIARGASAGEGAHRPPSLPS